MIKVLIEENKKLKEIIKKYKLLTIVLIIILFLTIISWTFFTYSNKKVYNLIKNSNDKNNIIIKQLKTKIKQLEETKKELTQKTNNNFNISISNNYILYNTKNWNSIIIKKNKLSKILKNKIIQNKIQNNSYNIFIKLNLTNLNTFINKISQ